MIDIGTWRIRIGSFCLIQQTKKISRKNESTSYKSVLCSFYFLVFVVSYIVVCLIIWTGI